MRTNKKSLTDGSPIWLILHTFECLIQFFFSKHKSQVMNCAGMELHAEYDISAGTSEALVIAFKLCGTLHLLEGQDNHQMVQYALCKC